MENKDLVGKRVRITSNYTGNSKIIGKEGVLEDEGDTCYRVILDNDKHYILVYKNGHSNGKMEYELIEEECPFDVNNWCYNNHREIGSEFIHLFNTIQKIKWDGDDLYYGIRNGNNIGGISKPFGPEITLEQFKKYIMKEEKKKIIGYKAPQDYFNGNTQKGWIFYKDTDGDSYRPKGHGPLNALPKEIVETWEAVYEELIKEEIVKIGNREVKITSKGEIKGTRNYTIQDWENLKKWIENTGYLQSKSYGDNYEIAIDTFSIGCEHNIKKEDVGKLIKVYYQLNIKS